MPSPSFEIAGRRIGSDAKPFVIAEMSGNHNQSLDRALEIVEAAAKAGAHGLKLQTYTPDTMTIDKSDGDFMISDPTSLWHGKSLYALYGEAHTPWAWHEPLFKRARELGMIPFSTPFDDTAVDFLETLGAAVYKIASFENIDLPLIKKVAKTGKPMIISTGMASASEIDDAVRTAKANGCKDLVLLKCTSTYPADPRNSNIATIPNMAQTFGVQVGLSDHTMGVGVAVASVALGATVIEKHFTLRRADGGVDSTFSLEPEELAMLVIETERAWQGMGTVAYRTSAEEKSKIFRRSLYVTEDLKAGTVLTAKNLRAIRPGYGLPPKYLDSVLGLRVGRDVKRGTAMSWELLSSK